MVGLSDGVALRIAAIYYLWVRFSSFGTTVDVALIFGVGWCVVTCVFVGFMRWVAVWFSCVLLWCRGGRHCGWCYIAPDGWLCVCNFGCFGFNLV